MKYFAALVLIAAVAVYHHVPPPAPATYNWTYDSGPAIRYNGGYDSGSFDVGYDSGDFGYADLTAHD